MTRFRGSLEGLMRVLGSLDTEIQGWPGLLDWGLKTGI